MKGHLANEESQNRLRKQQRLEETQAASDFKEVLNIPAGRRFVWAVIHEICGVEKQSFMSAPTETAYREGRRSVGIHLTQQAQIIAPDLFFRMAQESINSAADAALHRDDAKNIGDKDE